MNIVSWNVNGLRACLKNKCLESVESLGADVACFQEVRVPHDELTKIMPFDGYTHWEHTDAEKKGYSGVMTISKHPFLSVTKGIGVKKFDAEGRVLTTEFKDFYLINAYFPNTQRELVRLDFKLEFNKAIMNYMDTLDKKKPVIVTGDFNVAHEAIDLKNPKQNERNAGFTIEERDSFTDLLSRGYVDTFRALHPKTILYSWWTYRFNARAKGIGWRIDYFVVSARFMRHVKDSEIRDDVHGSDHCPVVLKIR